MVITLTNSGVSRPLGAPFRVDDAVTVAFSPQVAAGPPSHFHGSSGIVSGGYIQPPSHGPLPCALERGKRPAVRVGAGLVVAGVGAPQGGPTAGGGWQRSRKRRITAQLTGFGANVALRPRAVCAPQGGCCVESLPRELTAELSTSATLMRASAAPPAVQLPFHPAVSADEPAAAPPEPQTLGWVH